MNSNYFFKNNNYILTPQYFLNNKYCDYIPNTKYYPLPNFILPSKDYYSNNKFTNYTINPSELSVNLDFLNDFNEESSSMLKTILLEDSNNTLLKDIPLSESTGTLLDFDIDFIEKEEIKDYKEPEINILNYIFPINYKSLFFNIFKN